MIDTFYYIKLRRIFWKNNKQNQIKSASFGENICNMM